MTRTGIDRLPLWGNVCLVRARCATLVSTILMLGESLPGVRHVLHLY